MKFLVSASIVLYKNDSDVLVKSITSFLNTQLSVKLLLIDNSPTCVLKDIVKDERVEYFHNPSNPGFGAAHNIVIKRMLDCSKYHLVLNPDVYYEKGVLEAVVRLMDANSDIANVMPKVLYPDGALQYLCKLLPSPYDWIGRRFNPITSMVEKRNHIFELRFTNYTHLMDVPYLSGCFMFLRTEALNKVGLFDEGIFMYGEEADLCRRLISFGYRTVFFPEVSIFHHFEKGSHKSFHLTWIGIKSAVYYFNKWGWFFDPERRRINKRALNQLKAKES